MTDKNRGRLARMYDSVANAAKTACRAVDNGIVRINGGLEKYLASYTPIDQPFEVLGVNIQPYIRAGAKLGFVGAAGLVEFLGNQIISDPTLVEAVKQNPLKAIPSLVLGLGAIHGGAIVGGFMGAGLGTGHVLSERMD